MSRTIRKQMTLGLIALSLGVISFAGPASAQAPNDRPGTGTGTDATTTRVTRDDGFNPGWLGLLGLAGLAGLMPKKVHAVTTSTHRAGDAPVR